LPTKSWARYTAYLSKIQSGLERKDKVEELKETVEAEPTVEDVFKKTKRKK
jgi:hypothetical protein